MFEHSGETKRVRYRLVSGLFDLIVLGLLLEGGLGAFDIIRLISERFGTLISPGTIYPRLKTLKKLGLIFETSDGRRKVYVLTPQARQTINMIREEYDRMHFSLDVLMGSEGAGSSRN